MRGCPQADAAELKNAESGSGETKIVLVEVDEIENLRAAYPNYFGDVQIFKSKLAMWPVAKMLLIALCQHKSACPESRV